jgi:hypothetical protein
MRLTGFDLQTVAGSEAEHLGPDLHFELAVEHEEQLPGLAVQVLHFALTRSDALLDHAEVRPIEQAPTVARLAPGVVLCCLSVLDHERRVLRAVEIVHALHWDPKKSPDVAAENGHFVGVGQKRRVEDEIDADRPVVRHIGPVNDLPGANFGDEMP